MLVPHYDNYKKIRKHGDNTNLLNAKWWKIFKTHISGILLELKKKKKKHQKEAIWNKDSDNPKKLHNIGKE